MSNKFIFPKQIELYHGTLNIYERELRQGIDLSKCKDKSDFGKGFYLTYHLNQAEDWAKTLATRHYDFYDEFVHGAVFIYHVDYEILQELNGEIFLHYDENWTEFIYHNRTRQLHGINNTDCKFDFVYGSLADGNTTFDSYDLLNGKINFDEFKERISPSRSLGNQLSFHTPEAINSLKLKNKKLIPMTRRKEYAKT